MKKTLLFATAMSLCASSMSALSDGQTYEVVNGLKTTSIWCASLNRNPDTWATYPFSGLNYARTCCIASVEENGAMTDKVIVAWEALDNNSSGTLGRISIINFFSGEVEKTLVPTLDGTPIEGLLCCNQVGFDDFGHIWFAGYVASMVNATTGAFNPIKVYTLDNLETGACTLQFGLTLPEDEASAAGRVDYYSLVGDVTRQEGPCVFIATPCGNSKTAVCGWRAEQGSDTWEGIMEDGVFVSTELSETYPADLTDWGGSAASSTIIKDDDFTGEYFYVDAFTTCPSLYNTAGEMVESFASASDLAPKTGTNGVCEFTLGGNPFIFYSLNQYDNGSTCQARICQLGDGSAFDGMTEICTIPANGLGETSDAGNRIHGLGVRVYEDQNGVEGAYILTFKCRNGIAAYTVAPEDWVDPKNSGVEKIEADTNNAPVEYFNLNGTQADKDNLTPGLYISRQGSKVEKVVVR